jgi:adenylosuccinate synthase
VLLDEWRGFHPHTTWSTCTAARPLEMLEGTGREAVRLGVLRSYLTRHGQGPFPSECRELQPRTPEPHNRDAGWQGGFRRGWLDGVLLRYALECAPMDALAVTHLDRIDGSWRAVDRYEGLRSDVPCPGPTTCLDPSRAASPRRLPLGGAEDLAHQSALTTYVKRVKVRTVPVGSEAALLRFVEDVAGLPVTLGSHGPRAGDKRWCGPRSVAPAVAAVSAAG